MKKCFTLTLLYFLVLAGVYAQVEVFENDDALQGLRNKATGKVIMEPKYGEIQEFYEGIAAVELNKGWGYIDSTGKQIVSPEYAKAVDFTNGRGFLIKDSLNFWVTKWGEVTPLGPGSINRLYQSEYYQIAKEGRLGVINSSGELILPIEYLRIRLVKDNNYFIITKYKKYGIFNPAARVVVKAVYDDLRPERNLIAICKDKKWGFMDAKGTIVLPLLYKAALYFGDSTFAVLQPSGYSLITNTGKEVSSARYGYLCPYSDGKIIAETMKGRYGVIDNKSAKIIPFKYTSIIAESGLLKVRRGKKTGYINIKNELRIPISYTTALYGNDYIVVSKDGNFGVLDANGKIIVPLNYDTVIRLNKVFFVVEKGDRKGVYNKDGKELLPVNYNMIHLIGEGCFTADTTLIDYQGNKLLSGILDVTRLSWNYRADSSTLYSYKKLLSEGKRLENVGVINDKGKQLVAPEYEHIFCNECETFWVKKDNAWGMLDNTGKVLIDLKYLSVSQFREGEGLFEVSLNNKLGIVNEQGQEICPCEYQSLQIADPKRPIYIIAKKDGKYGVVDFKQNIVIPFEYGDIKYEDNCFKSAQWQTIQCKPLEK